jgi:hypothetical protein
MADITAHMQPDKLERYSFFWSETRLGVAALALFLGGIPPVYLLPLPFGIVHPLLTLAWVISGVVSAYLIYRWNAAGKKVFGKNDQKDTIAFFVNVVSGFNLGLAGVLGKNIGMSISSNHLIFLVVGIIYLVSAWHLWKRWKESGERMFAFHALQNKTPSI